VFWRRPAGIEHGSQSQRQSPQAGILEGLPQDQKILEEHRAGIQAMRKELRLFRKVKKLVMDAENEEPEKIHETLAHIAALFPKNVDKNVQKRR
jgi:hypothetical protein